MKKSAIAAVLFGFIGFSLNAQSGSSFGFKGGLNYSANGDYMNLLVRVQKIPIATFGYHIGVFGQIGSKLYFRAELVYTSTKSDYGTDVVSRIDTSPTN